MVLWDWLVFLCIPAAEETDEPVTVGMMQARANMDIRRPTSRVPLN